MHPFKFALIVVGFALSSADTLQAQSFTYSNVRKDYVFDDGFGIPHSKTVAQQGNVQISADEVVIDGATYIKNEKGVYKNAKGKSVDLSYGYEGAKLVAVRISTGHIINNYLVEESAPTHIAVVQK
jgi:hypothetical protein